MMQERLPSATQISSFGSTESCGFMCMGLATDSLELRTTTSGTVMTGMEVRAVDPTTGEDVPPGVPGEALYRGVTRFKEYFRDPEATRAAIDADGWFHSGDLITLDAEGRLSFVGRLKDMLKVGGENVAPSEIESHLSTHPAVKLVQVVGVADARLDEVPAAFIELVESKELTAEEVIEFCTGKIASFKVPRHVRFVTEWPMSATKIQKFRLQERLAAELAAARTG
jgi:fatty-acyl-CoA synthase